MNWEIAFSYSEVKFLVWFELCRFISYILLQCDSELGIDLFYSEFKLSKEFTSDAASSIETIQSLAATETRYAVADLTQLFKIAYEEGYRAERQGRILRVVLIYCRSSTKPHHHWPVKPKNFTMDVVYLHDKPAADNCPQNVYDALVDALEHVSQYEGYILESGQGLARVLFRQICIILSHPLLRCMQDDLDIPKQVVKKILAVEGVQSEDGAPVSSSQ